MLFLIKSMQRYELKPVFTVICIFLTLTLTKFELRVLLVNDEQATFATNNLAVGCTLF
jgi:hypothetical protein